MDRDRLLGAVSAAQLTTGILGLAVAMKRRHPYDVPLLHGRHDRVARDSVLMGTALSAPLSMIALQWVATRRALHGAGSPSGRVLGGLGATMVTGYFAESLVRQRLQRSGFDAVETPLLVVAISLSTAMAVLGLTSREGHESPDVGVEGRTCRQALGRSRPAR